MYEIPRLKKVSNRFEVTIRLKAWTGFQSRNGAYGALNSDEVSDGTCPMPTHGDMGEDHPEMKE